MCHNNEDVLCAPAGCSFLKMPPSCGVLRETAINDQLTKEKIAMPSTYAHYRFGRQACPLLGPDEQQTILARPEPFLIGLHGPDIFFYHHPLSSSPIRETGYRMHDEPGEAFFAPAADILSRHTDRQAGLSYLYGFLCHFALDSVCHPYVEEQVTRTGIAHVELEAEFDRMLMLHDGLDPLSHFPTGHIIPSMKNAAAAAPFFPDITQEQVQEVLKSMLTCSRLLLAPHLPKRLLIHAVFALSGKSSSMRGVLIPMRPIPACRESNRRLRELYRKALPLAADLIRNYRLFTEGKEELSGALQHPFA